MAQASAPSQAPPNKAPAAPVQASTAGPGVAGPAAAVSAPQGAAAIGPLANKPGEPEFQMKLSLDKLTFKSDKLNEEAVTVELTMQNPLPKRQVYKIKCTCNDFFRVRPPLGYVEPNETVKVSITYHGKDVPDAGKHFFALYHMTANDNPKDIRSLWKPDSKPEGVKRIMCSFEKANGQTWVVEKK